MGQSGLGFPVGSRGCFLWFPWESVVNRALALIPSQALPLDFEDLLSPNPHPEVWPHPKSQPEGKSFPSSLPFCGVRGSRGWSCCQPGES